MRFNPDAFHTGYSGDMLLAKVIVPWIALWLYYYEVWHATGSWLGRAHQNQGLGTEMRAGVLSFAFELLGAERATSGAIDGNPQSLAVSRKLGYAVSGEHTVAPRGVDRTHTDLVLERAAFRSPVRVEVVGFDGLQSLFGVEP